MKINYAIVFVSNMQESIAFYRDVIGLPLRFETTHWTEFDAEGTVLALHLSETVPSETKHPGPDPVGSCRPGLQVPDINKFHNRMQQQGVRCVQEPKDVFGSKIAQYLDPDGLILSVSEEKNK